MTYQKLTRDQHFQAPGPKRILALDGGGLRGIVSLAFLKRIEDLLRARHGGDHEFRLCHYFDLVAGTSTGAIIASALAKGMSVDELVKCYLDLGRRVFARSFWRRGVLLARYDEATLQQELKDVLGATTTLGGPELLTGLLVVTKRLDTGSPWPLANNPRGKYFRAGPHDTWISNGDYLLWEIIRASTAAPTYFDPERITISTKDGRPAIEGEFLDGGVSPYNNPSLQALLYATLEGFRVGWNTGADNLLVISVGTGAGDPSQTPSWIAAQGAMKALLSLTDDCAALVETMMQWMSTSPTARLIDQEVGDLGNDLLGGAPRFTYQRYQLPLTRESVDALMPGIQDDTLESLKLMDEPHNLELLKDLGEIQASRSVLDQHFPARFDLRPVSRRSPSYEGSLPELSKFLRKTDTNVVAVQLNLDTEGFPYRKWGGTQACKPGDWLVDNSGDVYTVDGESFERTYERVSPGVYRKTAAVWARVADAPGSIRTREGETRYEAGDYLVFNDADGADGYAMSRARFEQLYARAAEGD